jgi:uncharacterized protein with HEPN domain
MQRDDSIRINHIIDAARDAITFSTDRTRHDLEEDRMLVFALMKAIEIIGEAASKISQDTRNQYAEIPWQRVVGMRNRLIHAYADVDLNILWETVKTALPQLIHSLEKIIANSPY